MSSPSSCLPAGTAGTLRPVALPPPFIHHRARQDSGRRPGVTYRLDSPRWIRPRPLVSPAKVIGHSARGPTFLALPRGTTAAGRAILTCAARLPTRRPGSTGCHRLRPALQACCPWGDVGAHLESGRRAAELEGPGSPWRPVACWAVGMGLYFRGEPEQRMLAEGAARLVREHGTEKASGVVPLALGVSLAARQAAGGRAADRVRYRLAAFPGAAGRGGDGATAPRIGAACPGRPRALAGGDHRGDIHRRVLSRSEDPARAADGFGAVPAAGHQVRRSAADAAGAPGAPAADQRPVRARHRPAAVRVAQHHSQPRPVDLPQTRRLLTGPRPAADRELRLL
jgi:hypothetical protein